MASERAKKLAADQKAAMAAEKLRKKQSDDPKDWGRMRQIVEAFKVTKQYDKKLLPLMIGGFLILEAIGVLLSFFLTPWWMWIIFGTAFGLLAPMYILSWRARVAMYTRFEGQPGAAEVAFNLLPKNWVKSPVIAFNRYQDIVHRVVGPVGIVLIGEGQAGRVRELLNTETKRHEAIKYQVPVTALIMGDAANQVPLRKLHKTIKKLPKAIKPSQVTEVTARLKALDATRSRLPIPKGPMPSTKGARAAIRGK